LEVFNILQHPVWVFDLENKAMFWANTAAVKVWNAATLQELLSRDFAHDMSAATEQRIKDYLIRLKRNEVIQDQWTFHPSGKAITLGVTASAIRIDGGRIAVLSETELPGSREIDHLSTRGVEILRHLPLAVCQFDVEGTLLYQNPEALSVFGTPAHDDERSICLARFVDRELGEGALETVQEENDYNVEAEQYTNTGPKWFNVSLRKSRDPVTSETVIIYSARDITEICQARKDTTQANLKAEFMAVMAHEIRTPLHQIIGYTDLLELTDLSAEQFDQLEMIQSSTGLLMAIINDLLDYSKLENGQLQLENICFPTRGILQGCMAAIEGQAKEKGLKLFSHFSDDLPAELIGDPNRIRQILLNLLQNALKFTKQGSITMTISTVECNVMGDEQPVSRLRFEVADTGIGIDPSQQEIIFEKYQQGHASVARNYGGTGLGLAICKSLSQNMGGSITLRSEVGKGTTFIVEIPFVLPEKRANTEAPRKRRILDEPNPLGFRILVADDNKVSQKMVRSMLSRMGHEVTIADNGQIAVDEMQKSDFDLVLMDVQMPVMGGIEATRQIRKLGNKTRSNIPIVGLTASYQHSDLQLYLDVGMTSCLGKPLRLEALKAAIEQIMG
jgi:signal transduction histidine kinase